MSAAIASRVPARELIDPAALAALRERVEWKSIALIVHAWAVIFARWRWSRSFPIRSPSCSPSC